MKASARIRKWSGIILVGASFLATPLTADEILLNSDFSKDTENWSGDFSNDPSEDNPLDPHSSGQITLNLRDRRPVRIFQAFNADTDKLVCNVSFTLSDGGAYTGIAKVADVASDVNVDEYSGSSYNSYTGVVTSYSNPNYGPYQTPFQGPVIILADPDDSSVLLCRLTKSGGNGSSGTTYSVHATVRPHRSYRLYLAFPPGNGSVTITKISLQPDTGQSSLPPVPVVAPDSNIPSAPRATLSP